MPKTLTDPDIINGIVTDEEITSVTIVMNGRLYIVFDRKDAEGNVIIPDASHLIEGVEMQAAIARASEIAGADVYGAIKQALYEFLPGNGAVS